MNDNDQFDETKSFGKFRTDQSVSKREADRELPETIGRFKILRLLGEGGFASVYLAQDPSLERQVAVKVPHSSRREEYLRREARMAAKLEHPAIVQIYEIHPTSASDSGEVAQEDLLVYVVMQ